MRAARLRRLWLNVHLWLGVGLMIPVIVLGISGSLLAFDGEVDRLLSPARYAVAGGEPAPLPRLLSAARGAVGQDFAIVSKRCRSMTLPALHRPERASSDPMALFVRHVHDGDDQSIRLARDHFHRRPRSRDPRCDRPRHVASPPKTRPAAT